MTVVRIVPAALWFEWELIKGDSFDLVVPVLDGDQLPVEVDGWTTKTQVRRSSEEPLLFEWSTTEGNAALDGTDVVLTVDGALTRLWTWSNAQISIEIYEPSTATPHTIAHGTIRALPEITQE